MPSSFKRANKALRTLKTYLGRTIPYIARQIAGEDELQTSSASPSTSLPAFLSSDRTREARRSIACMRAEVECIGKGKAHAPYEFRREGLESPPRCTARKAGSSRCMPWRCPETLMMATRWQPSFLTWSEPSATASPRILAVKPATAVYNAPLSTVQGLHLRPETPHDARHQARDAPPLRRRTRDRAHQERPPDGPQLSLAGSQGDAINAVLSATGYTSASCSTG